MKLLKKKKQIGVIFNYAWVYLPSGEKRKAYVPKKGRPAIYICTSIFLIAAIIALILGSYPFFGGFLSGAVAMPFVLWLTDFCGISRTQTLKYIEEGCYPITPQDARILIEGLKISRYEEKIKAGWVNLAQTSDEDFDKMTQKNH